MMEDLDFSAFTSAKRILIRKGRTLMPAYLGHVDDTTGSGADERLSHVPILRNDPIPRRICHS